MSVGPMIGASMRTLSVVTQEIYEHNLGVFNDVDRSNAQTALDTYMYHINGAGLRCEFDQPPQHNGKLASGVLRHLARIDSFKAQVGHFGAFIDILEMFGDRPAVQLNPQWVYDRDVAETVTRTISPEAISTYRYMHEAFIAYFGELGKPNPSELRTHRLACQVACTIQPDAWRKIGCLVPRDIVPFGSLKTRDYLQAVLALPRRIEHQCRQ